MDGLNFLSVLFVFAVGVVFLLIVFIFISDVTQTKNAIRRNYPVIGHFRYIFLPGFESPAVGSWLGSTAARKGGARDART
jgi:hypothetical protein